MDTVWKDGIDLAIKFAVAVYGAVWAYYLLRVLRQRELARISESKGIEEIEKLKIELRSLAAEKSLQIDKLGRENQKLDQDIEILRRQLRLRTIITIAIEASVVPNPDGQGFIVLGIIELINQGNLDVRFAWEEQEPPVRMSRVRFRTDGAPAFDQEAQARVRMTSQPNADAPAHIVRAGGKEAVVFALFARVSGLYLLSFRAEGAPLDPKEAEKIDTGRPRPWTASRYILVGETSLPTAVELAATPSPQQPA